MKKARIDIHEAVTLGPIKALNGVNNGPLSIYDGQKFLFDASSFYQEMEIPRVRLHDVEYPYGGGLFVDYECIFPNFDLDANDPANYHFEETDRFLAAIAGTGAGILYRLGVSIEDERVLRFIYPPRDFHKFAVICEHILAHYTKGWKRGFYYRDILWEIWNEPNGTTDMWTGGNDAYCEMYAVTAKHLKKCFPDALVGGPTVSYMTGVLWPNCSLILEAFKEKLRNDPEIPLDFFSFHNYACEPEDVGRNAQIARELLEAAGRPNAFLVMDEYNYVADWKGPEKYDIIPSQLAAAFLAANFTVMQNSPIREACYYSAQISPERIKMNGMFGPPTGAYKTAWNGLYKVVDGRLETLPAYEAMLAFRDLRRLGTQVETIVAGDARVYALAATNGRRSGAYLVNFSPDPAEVTFRDETRVMEPYEIARREWACVSPATTEER